MRDRFLLAPVTMLMVAAAAFFQARGFSSLMHEALASPVPPGLDARRAAGVPEVALHHTSAQRILERNPLDSTRGSLLPAPESAPEALAARAIDDPYEAPLCPGSRVVALASRVDATDSFAIVATGPDRRRVQQGSELPEGRVWFIGVDRLWVVGAEGLCQSALFGAAPLPVAAASSAPPASGAPPAAPNRSPAVAALLAKIKPLGPREFAVDRATLEQAREVYGELARQVKIRPEVEGGQVQGLRVLAATPGSLEATLGLETGDVIESLNGHGWAPEEALRAYTDLLSGRDVGVRVRRKGAPLQIDLRVR